MMRFAAVVAVLLASVSVCAHAQVPSAPTTVKPKNGDQPAASSVASATPGQPQTRPRAAKAADARAKATHEQRAATVPPSAAPSTAAAATGPASSAQTSQPVSPAPLAQQTNSNEQSPAVAAVPVRTLPTTAYAASNEA